MGGSLTQRCWGRGRAGAEQRSGLGAKTCGRTSLGPWSATTGCCTFRERSWKVGSTSSTSCQNSHNTFWARYSPEHVGRGARVESVFILVGARLRLWRVGHVQRRLSKKSSKSVEKGALQSRLRRTLKQVGDCVCLKGFPLQNHRGSGGPVGAVET